MHQSPPGSSASHSPSGTRSHHSHPDPDATHASPLFVRTMIVLTIGVTVAMVSLIYVRWVRVVEPTAYIHIIGDPLLDGAEVTILSKDNPDFPTVTVILNDESRQEASVLLVGGSYTLVCNFRERELIRQDFYIRDRYLLRVVLMELVNERPTHRDAPPTTEPSETQPQL